jgi:ubiquinone/menaquinone biosynthesis C-methylase UbiE
MGMDERTLNAIQKSYDGIADEYARHLYSELDNKPLDRELLTRFAARVKGKGAICDMGCGPGHIARFLHDAGTNVFGLDLSSRMIEEARRLNPEISFRQGNMLALDLPDTSLAGIAAFYAIVNLPRAPLPQVFREMARVLKPDGLLLLAFSHRRRNAATRRIVGPPRLHGFLFLPAACDPARPRSCRSYGRRTHRARTLCARSGTPEPPGLYLRAQASRGSSLI